MTQTRTLRITFELDDPEPPHPNSVVGREARGALEDARTGQLRLVMAHRDQLQRDVVAACAERDRAVSAQALAEQALDILVAQDQRDTAARDAWQVRGREQDARIRELEAYVASLERERQAYFDQRAALYRGVQSLRERIRPNAEAAPWVCDELDTLVAVGAL